VPNGPLWGRRQDLDILEQVEAETFGKYLVEQFLQEIPDVLPVCEVVDDVPGPVAIHLFRRT